MTFLEVDQIDKSEPFWAESLTAIHDAVGILSERRADGWTRAAARLLAIDTALLVLRRDELLNESDRQIITDRLCRARDMVDEGWEDDLGQLQAGLEVFMSRAWSHGSRDTWLAAMNATLTNPYRAAMATVESAMAYDRSGSLGRALRMRLAARMREFTRVPATVSPMAGTA